MKVEKFLEKLFGDSIDVFLSTENGLIFVESGWQELSDLQNKFDSIIKEIKK